LAALGACTVPDRPYRSDHDAAVGPTDPAIDAGVRSVVVTEGVIKLDEGQTSTYHVTLAGPAPTHDITAEFTIDFPALFRVDQPNVVFTAADYQQPHALSFVAYQDADAIDNTAHVIFTSDDLTTQRVQVVIHDDDHQGIHTSSDSIVLPEGTATIV